MSGHPQDITSPDTAEEVSNPLDSVEEIMTGQDWSVRRPTPDELMVHVEGRLGTYALTFIWQEEYSAMQFFCELDLFIPEERMEIAGQTLRTINEALWLGHFDIPESRQTPCFRHTTLFRGLTQTSGADHIRDLVEIAVAECDRYHGAFNMLANALSIDGGLMDLALSDSAGEA